MKVREQVIAEEMGWGASMKNFLKIGVAIGLGMLATASARADTTLLSLTDMAYTETLYDLGFIANASTTTLSVAGYQFLSHGWRRPIASLPWAAVQTCWETHGRLSQLRREAPPSSSPT